MEAYPNRPLFTQHNLLGQRLGLLAICFALIVGLAGCGTLEMSAQIQEHFPTPLPAGLVGTLFESNIELLGYALTDLNIPTDEDVALRLFWRTSALPPVNYEVTLRLIDSNGNLVWSAAGLSVIWDTERLVTEHHLRFPHNLNETDYALEVGLFDPATGRRAEVSAPGQGTAVRLAIVHLTGEPGTVVTPHATVLAPAATESAVTP